jgi:outer membrane lipoprotein-sorting protein
MLKRYLVILATVLTLALSTSVRAADEKLTAAEIINKHLSAAGGKEALAKVKSRVAIGTVKRENQAEAHMVIMSEAPDRVSAAYVFQDSTWRLIYDKGKTVFRPSLTREYTVVEDKYREMLASGFMFNGIALYNALTAEAASEMKVEAKGTKKINGRQAYVVECKRDKKSGVVRLFFDAENFMWVRTEFGRLTIPKQIGAFTNAVESRSDDEPVVDFYVETSDFRDVDGIKLPFRLVQVVTFPLLRQKQVGTITSTINEYRQNIEIDPKMFQ